MGSVLLPKEEIRSFRHRNYLFFIMKWFILCFILVIPQVFGCFSGKLFIWHHILSNKYSSQLTEEQMTDLKLTFSNLDKEDDGSIGIADLIKHMSWSSGRNYTEL